MTAREKVRERLERAYPVQLRVSEIAQSTDLGHADVIDALCELEEDGLVQAVEWRAVRENKVVA